MNYLDQIQQKREEYGEENAVLDNERKQIIRDKRSTEAIIKAIKESGDENKKHRSNTVIKTEVQNPEVEINNLPDIVLREDAQKIVDAINNIEKPDSVEFRPVIESLKELGSKLDQLPKEYPEVELPETVVVNNLSELKDFVTPVVEAINKLDLKPVVNVEQESTEVDLEPLLSAISELGTKFEQIKIPELDLTQLVQTTEKVTQSIQNLKFPVPNYILPFKDINGKAIQAQLTVDGKIPVEAGATSTYESINDTTTDTNLVYLGKALPGTDTTDAAWQIKRYNKSAGHMSFADDETTFTKQWSERTTYGY